MELQRFELDVWKSAAHHPEVAAVLEAILPLLAEVLPAREIALWHVAGEHLRAELLADFVDDRRATPGPPRPLTGRQAQDLTAWCAEHDILYAEHGTHSPPALLAPVATGPLAALALSLAGQKPYGILLLCGLQSPWDEACAAAAQRLRAPLSVALANHVRLQALMRSAEAFEADRQALLHRLDRQDISDSVIGAETGLREVVERVRQVAPTDAPVLIFGETGAGKEVVARQIHGLSPRAAGPMVRVNCGAIAPELIDSELFGHERGSFTGASATRKGWFERSDGGTLFLDEIGELSLAAQVRVLRVLQDGVFERVGGERSLHVDVRIVAATHRDLEQMVRDSSFRHDLWYRIGVFPIRLPPLRERREDIAALATHFARRATKRLGGQPLSLSADDIALLVRYDWPGNIRELAAVIERAAILGNGRRLEVAAALGVTMTSMTLPPATVRPTGAPSTLAEMNARHIEDALRCCRGRIEGPFGAAERLHINPNTLRSRMRKLGIGWQRFRDSAPDPPNP